MLDIYDSIMNCHRALFQNCFASFWFLAQLVASASPDCPIAAVLEFLAKMAVSASPDSNGDREKVGDAASSTNEDDSKGAFPTILSFPQLLVESWKRFADCDLVLSYRQQRKIRKIRQYKCVGSNPMNPLR